MHSDRVANVELRAAVRALKAAAGESAQFDSVEAKAERVLLVQQARALVDALCVTAAGVADLGGVAGANGAGTVSSFVGVNACVQPSKVRADTRLARWLRRFDVLEAAFGEGRIPRSHLERIRELDNARTHVMLVRDQALFVEFAETLLWRDFLAALRYWMLAADPDGAEPKEQMASVGVRMRKNADGTVSGSFVLDPLRGEAVLRAFEVECQKLAGVDEDTGVVRSRFRRGADALVALVSRGFGRADGSQPGVMVNVVVSQHVVEQMIDRINGDVDPDEPFRLDREDPDHRCELIDGTPLHPWFAMQAMSVGRFQRHVFDVENRVIETSKARFFPDWMRTIFHLESRGRCTDTGCDAPFAWLQADHDRPWSLGGETSLRNGQDLCGMHNQVKSDRLPYDTDLDLRRLTKERIQRLAQEQRRAA